MLNRNKYVERSCIKPLQFTVCLQSIKQKFDLRLENIAAYFNIHIYRHVYPDFKSWFLNIHIACNL